LRTVFYISGKVAEEINYKNNLKNGFTKNILKKVVLEESIF
jgi:antitoxin component YwqK of YwqJK toxin-antitoxin module